MATEWSPPSVMQILPEEITLVTEAASAALYPLRGHTHMTSILSGEGGVKKSPNIADFQYRVRCLPGYLGWVIGLT